MKNTARKINFFALLTLFFSANANAQTWYQDSDADGYGNVSVSQVSVSQPTGYVRNNIDRDDAVKNETAWGRIGKKGFTSVSPLNSNLDLTVGPTGTAYSIFLNGTTNMPTAMKKAEGDSVWSVVDIVDFSSRDANPTQSVTNCAIAVDSKDTLWAVMRKQTYLLLMRWHASANGGQWLSMGSRIASINVDGVIDIAIGANDTPFVVYRAGSDRPRCQKMNPATRAWEQAAPGAADNYIVNAAIRPEFITIAMGPTNIPYVAYKRTNSTGQNDYQAVVYKRNASASGWDLIGNTAASEGTGNTTQADSIELAVDGSGNPYIFYSDFSNSRAGKGTVRKYNGTSWTTVGTAGFTAGAIYMSAITIDPITGTVYIAYADNGDEKLYVKKLVGNTWASVFDSSIATSVRSVTLEVRNSVLYVLYKDGNNSNLASAKRYGPSRTWKGTTSTTWADARNWAGFDMPEDGDAVTFKPLTSFEPSTPAGTTNFRSLSIQSGDSLTIGSSSVFAVNGSLLVSGKILGSGSVSLNSTVGAQTISGTGTVNNLELNNSNGASIQAGSTLSITDTYTPTAGTLTTNSGLRMKSSASGTARIAAGTGTYISGAVTVERYIPGGRRANRYFSHPFTTAQPISQLTGEIDVTGTGGATNGFTGTSTNAASSWWYDPTVGDESTINDPGWTVFTSANGSGANDWNQYQAIKVLVRGVKGQGLNGQAYTPSATTVTMTGGTLNMGNQVVPLTKGVISGYNLVGNPFPSQIDLSATIRDVNIEPNFWVWNPNGGTKGIYEANPFFIPYYLPAYGGFFARTVNNTNNTITFPESVKVSNTSATLFKTTGAASFFTEIRVEDSSSLIWDKFFLSIDSSSTPAKEKADAAKFFNSEFNFFSFSSNKDSLAIDSRAYVDSQVVKIDMWNGVKGKFILNVNLLGMPKGTSLYLEDSFTNTTVKLTAGYKYPFTTTTDTKSEHNRFYLRFEGKPEVDTVVPPKDTSKDTTTAILQTDINVKRLDFDIFPNPVASGIVNIKMLSNTSDVVALRILNMLGQEVYYNGAQALKNGIIHLPSENLASGGYLVEIACNGEKVTKQLLKR